MAHIVTEFMTSLKKQARLLKQDRRGSMLVAGGILMPLIILFCAVAIEYSMSIRLTNKVQNTADAALMAAAIEIKKLDDLDNETFVESELQRHFNNHFAANMGDTMPPAYQVAKMDYDPDENSVKAEVSFDYNHAFSLISGNGSEGHSVETQIGLTTQSKEPISMILVLDKSGSMGGNNRMGSLKTAVASMTQQLNTADPETKYVRMGVVFYNSSTSGLTVDWGSNTANALVQATHAGGGTNSTGAMTIAVDRLIGNAEDQNHSQRNNGSPRKIILFLTDGANNQSSSDTATISHCDRAKNNNVEIYSVAFEAPAQGQALLNNCASSADHYFNSQNSAQLIAAFSEIAEITAGRLAFWTCLGKMPGLMLI